MRILRYDQDGVARYGLLEADGTVRELVGSPFGTAAPGAVVGPVTDLRLLPPVEPPKIICVGLNYREHIRETNAQTPEFPMLFMKPRTALVGHGQPIVYPRLSKVVHYEAELAVVIGRRARRVSPEQALDYVLGYTCANDVSARDWQRREMAHGFLFWGKGFDTFAPLGPWIVTDIDASDLAITLRLNGEVRQAARTSDLLFTVPRLISDISQAVTLEPGDVILTGTPSGVGPIQPGDVVEVEIEKIGVLRNPVVAEE